MKGEEYSWSKKNHSIFEDYAIDLQEFWQNGSKIKSGSRMLNVSMDKQREHMEKNNLRMTYDFVPRGHLSDKSIGKGWKDDIYSNKMECRTCEMTRRIFNGEKQIYKHRENIALYMTITTAHNRDVSAKQTYNCPNCGALSTVEQLEDMCPYCQTRFKISELFPKVTNFYTVKDDSGTGTEIRARVIKFVLPFILISIVGFFIDFNYIHPHDGGFAINSLSAVLSGTVFGGIMGYIIWAFTTIGGLFREAGKALPMVVASTGSQKKFVNLVKKYSPEFSYEYFTNKVVTILRQLLSEMEIENNPYYIGEHTNIDAPSIVEYAFRGAVALKKCSMDGPNCNVIVDVYMTDYYWKNDCIHKKDDVFRISLTKNLSKEMNYHFSLSAIECKSCGASFDATRTKKCPYCENEYFIGDDDWVVTAIEKK